MYSFAPFPLLMRLFGILAVATTATIIVSSNVASAFVVAPPAASAAKMTLEMGLFDFVQDAFKNEDYDDRRVTASHILVDSEDEAAVVMKSIESGETTFAKAAQDFSSCPSSADGGSLGTFEPGSMVKEFDDLVFDEAKSPVGEVIGPLKTKFGYHVVLVEDRSVNTVRSEGGGIF